MSWKTLEYEIGDRVHFYEEDRELFGTVCKVFANGLLGITPDSDDTVSYIRVPIHPLWRMKRVKLD